MVEIASLTPEEAANVARYNAGLDKGHQLLVEFVNGEAPMDVEDLMSVAIGFNQAVAQCIGGSSHQDNERAGRRCAADTLSEIAHLLGQSAQRMRERHGLGHDA